MRHGEPNHTCRICGKPYFACDTCDAKIGKTWRTVACTAEHYDVYIALWKYCNGQMGEDEVKEILTAAEANRWVNSPSLDVIIGLIGEPVDEEEQDAEEVVEETAEAPVEDVNTVTEATADEAVTEYAEVASKVYGADSVNKQNNYGSYRHKKRHR